MISGDTRGCFSWRCNARSKILKIGEDPYEWTDDNMPSKGEEPKLTDDRPVTQGIAKAAVLNQSGTHSTSRNMAYRTPPEMGRKEEEHPKESCKKEIRMGVCRRLRLTKEDQTWQPSKLLLDCRRI